MKTNKLLLSAAFVAISASGFAAAIEQEKHAHGAAFHAEAPAYVGALMGTDTEELLMSVITHDLSPYLNRLRLDKIAKVHAFIDAFAPMNGQFLDHGVNLYGGTIPLADGTRDSFKHALQQVIESVHPAVPAPFDARLSSLARVQSDVDMAFADAISAFIDSFLPFGSTLCRLIDFSVTSMHDPMSAYGTDGSTESIKRALIDAILQEQQMPVAVAERPHHAVAPTAMPRHAQLAASDTDALLEYKHSGDLSPYLNLMRDEKKAKASAFIDALVPGAGSQMLDHSVNLYGAMVNGLPIMLMDGTRESFKMALNQVIDSVNPAVPAPVDVKIDSLANTKEQVDVAFMDAISGFIDSLVPGAGSPMIDLSMVHMHGAAISGAYGEPMNGTRDSFKDALIHALIQ